MKKKARFLQFAAPYSDETQHSISQAVILEGKYWRRRLETVTHEFKKWRRLHKEKVFYYILTCIFNLVYILLSSPKHEISKIIFIKFILEKKCLITHLVFHYLFSP